MKGIRSSLIISILLLLTGCSSGPFALTELTPTSHRSTASLVQGLWSSGNEILLIRHSALFEMQGMKIPITAMLQLDLREKRARLVGMNDMGVKLYDVSVTVTSSHAHFIIPELDRYPGFAEAVAVSVRRIFLDPVPAPGDILEITPKSYLITRTENSGAMVCFKLGGADAQLIEKSYRGGSESWSVRYYQSQRGLGMLFPEGIVLEDDRAGYRLTLWIENVGKDNE